MPPLRLPEELFAAIGSKMPDARDLAAWEQTCRAARRACATIKCDFLAIQIPMSKQTPEGTRDAIEWLRRRLDGVERLFVVANLAVWADVWRSLPYAIAPLLATIHLTNSTIEDAILLSPEDYLPICPVTRLSINTYGNLSIGEGFSRLATLKSFAVIAAPYHDTPGNVHRKAHRKGTNKCVRTAPRAFIAPQLLQLNIVGRVGPPVIVCENLRFLSMTCTRHLSVPFLERLRNLQGLELSNVGPGVTVPGWTVTDEPLRNPELTRVTLTGVWAELRWMPAALETLELTACRGIRSLPRDIKQLVIDDVECYESVVEDLEHMTLGIFFGRKVRRIDGIDDGLFPKNSIAAYISAQNHSIDYSLINCVFD